MKVWRAGDRLIAQIGERVVEVDAAGEIVHTWYAGSSSADDDLYTTTLVVVGGTLFERTTMEHHGARFVKEEREERLREGLSETNDVQATSFVTQALARAEQARADAGSARVAEPRRALRGYDIHPDLERARDVLEGRLLSSDDALCSSLLATLVALAKSRPEVPVAVAYARGCLLACFEKTVPELVDAMPRPLPIASELAARAKDLHDASDLSESFDSHGQASAYFRAAKAIEHAAKLAGWSAT